MSSGYASWAARWRVPFGFALGLAFLVLSQPTRKPLVAGAAIASVGVALRAVAAGYLEKNVGLAASGPYAWTRNPLYLGSFLVGVGFALAGGSWIWGFGFLGFFISIYWPVMRREEGALRQQFGEAYEQYAKSVPFFFPTGRTASRPAEVARPGPAHAGWAAATRWSAGPEERFRWGRYRKNREYSALLGFLAAWIFLALKMALR